MHDYPSNLLIVLLFPTFASMKRTKEDILTLKAVVLYIIENSSPDRRDVYSIVKTAFYAQQMQFANSGMPLYKDDICALPFGPVPSDIYHILKMARGDQSEKEYHKTDGLIGIADAIGFDSEVFFPKENPDMDYLSKSDVEAIDSAIKRVAEMSFDDIVKDTHSQEWDRVFNGGKKGRKVMDNLNIAKEGNASPEMLEYLKEFFALEDALR